MDRVLGFRYEAERGFTQSSFGKSPADRRNYSYTLQVAGSLANRFYYTLSSGIVEKRDLRRGSKRRACRLRTTLMRPDIPQESSAGTKVAVVLAQASKRAEHLQCRKLLV